MPNTSVRYRRTLPRAPRSSDHSNRSG
jgi:hypothetical protein